MASPQKENGYTAIAHELLEAIIACDIPSGSLRCFLFVIRKTYGYNKKIDKISISQFCSATGLSKFGTIKAIDFLVKSGVLEVKKGGSQLGLTRETNSYLILKDYHQWRLVNSSIPLVNSSNRTGQLQGKGLVNSSIHTKDNIQKTITKEATLKNLKEDLVRRRIIK